MKVFCYKNGLTIEENDVISGFPLKHLTERCKRLIKQKIISASFIKKFYYNSSFFESNKTLLKRLENKLDEIEYKIKINNLL